MRNILILIVVFITFAAAISIGVSHGDKEVLTDLMLSNIEALAQEPEVKEEVDGSTPNEGGGGGFLRGYEASTRWVLESVSIGFPSGVQIQYVPIQCCKQNNNPMSGCDSSMADSKC